MLKIGITGGIGAGKSTVCRIFETLGIPVFYADDEAKKILQSDVEVIEKIKRQFGNDIYDDRVLDRKKLAAVVFNDEEKLELLNAMIHPAVQKTFLLWANKQQNIPYVLHEAALLFEAEAEKNLDEVITVSAPAQLRINRIVMRDGASEEEIKLRMKHQWSEEEKIARADFVVVNDDEHLLIPQVMKIHLELSAGR